MPNVVAGLGLLGLGVMVVVAVGTIAYSLLYDPPQSHSYHQHDRSQSTVHDSTAWNAPHSSSSTTTAEGSSRRRRKKGVSSSLPSSQYSDTDSCSICKDAIINENEQEILPCNHRFHYKCICNWFKACTGSTVAKGTCPMCRATFSAQDLI